MKIPVKIGMGESASMKAWVYKIFQLNEASTSITTELMAGLTTFLTMSYIIVVQPAVLSGQMFGMDTGMDFGALMSATCISSAIATLLMGVLARYPIALAPGMGANFFFVLTVLPAASSFPSSWRTGLGVILISGVLFLILTVSGIREKIMNVISPNLKHAISVGIGLFIAFIGFQNTGLIHVRPGTGLTLDPRFLSPDILIFFTGLITTAALMSRNKVGAILMGMFVATLATVFFWWSLSWLPDSIVASDLIAQSMLVQKFQVSTSIFSTPPSMAPIFFEIDPIGALSISMIPYIIMFLFVDVFDTMGTLVAVGQSGGFMKEGKLPRANRAFLADALGTIIGAFCGSSTVTAYIESVTGIKQGGRTGLTAICIAALFLLALFISPLIQMIGTYPPITAPALVIVGGLMIKNITELDFADYSEFLPAFVIILGIPLSYSIADGIALGFVSYCLVKLAAGKYRDANWLVYLMGILMFCYFVFLRSPQV